MSDRPEDKPFDDAEVERMLAELAALDTTEEEGEPTQQHTESDQQDTGPQKTPQDAPTLPARLALVLTPVASAPALAGLCAMSNIDVGVVPTSSGALAVMELPERPPPEDWDIGELLAGPDGGAALPPEGEELARTLSRLSRAGVVLVSAELASDVGIESGLSGQVVARRYADGEDAGDVAPGLIIATADQVVEDLILGRSRPSEVRGYQRSGDLPRWKAARMFGKGLRRRKP